MRLVSCHHFLAAQATCKRDSTGVRHSYESPVAVSTPMKRKCMILAMMHQLWELFQELSLKIQGRSRKQKGKHTKHVKPRQPSCKDVVNRISLGGATTDMLGLSQLCPQWEINLHFFIVPTVQGWEQVSPYLFLQRLPSAVTISWRSLYHLQWTIIKHSKTWKTVYVAFEALVLDSKYFYL